MSGFNFRIPPDSTVQFSGGSWGLAGTASGFPSFGKANFGVPTSQGEPSRLIGRRANPNCVFHYMTKMRQLMPMGKMDLIFNETREPVSSAAVRSGVYNASSLNSVSMVNAILSGDLPFSNGEYLNGENEKKFETAAQVLEAFRFIGVGLNIGNVTNDADAELLDRAILNTVVHGMATVFNYWAWCPFYNDVKNDEDLKAVFVSPAKLAVATDLYLVLRRVKRADIAKPAEEKEPSIRDAVVKKMTAEEQEEYKWQFQPAAVLPGATIPSDLLISDGKMGAAIHVGMFDNHRNGYDYNRTMRDASASIAMQKYISPVRRPGEGNHDLIHWANEAIVDPVATKMQHGEEVARLHGLPICEIHVRV